MKESQGDANVALLTSDATIIANCRKTEELLFLQTFSCEHLVARDPNSIQIRSADWLHLLRKSNEKLRVQPSAHQGSFLILRDALQLRMNYRNQTIADVFSNAIE